jgi:hypothetical protein
LISWSKVIVVAGAILSPILSPAAERPEALSRAN